MSDAENKDIAPSGDGENQEQNGDSEIKGLVANIEQEDPALLDGVKDKKALITKLVNKIVPFKTVSFRQEETHEGPLPHPTTLEKYDGIVSGGAERIFKVFENQSNHRMNFESKVVESEINLNNKGQNYAFILSLVFVAAGFFLVSTGHPTAGISVMTIDIGGVAFVFITGRMKKRREKSEE